MSGMGIIPTWQFSADWHTNPNLNPFVPSTPAWDKAMTAVNTGMGLGYVMVNPRNSTLGPKTLDQLRTTGQIAGVTDLFRAGGWFAENKTLLIGGGIALAVLGGVLLFV